MPELVLPNQRYKDSYLQAVALYREEKNPVYAKRDPAWLATNFDAFIQQLHDEAKGVNLPEGYVPHTEFWLVEGDAFLGRLDIRHELNDYLEKIGGHIGYDVRKDQRGKGYGTLILKLGLLKAKELGLQNILITCDIDNLPSKKVIEGNGGIYQSTEQGKNRYRIQV